MKILDNKEFQKLKFQFTDNTQDQYQENLILFLHGLGDNNKNYFNLAKQLNLPQSSILSVQAPYKLPFTYDHEEMYMWWDSFNLEDGSELNITHRDKSYQQSLTLLKELLDYTQSKGYKINNTFLFGYSQGGTMALQLALEYPLPLCGVIAIAALPLDSFLEKQTQHSMRGFDTKLLFIIGDKDEKNTKAIYTNSINKLKDVVTKEWDEYIKLKIIKGKGHEMSHKKEEVDIWMEFFSSNLKLRQPQLEAMADEIIEIKREE
ncbi:alpha/beta-hydrolase [Neoconidiobolus thromboides FSU 785]|nr:alpha/beta-hydrolase [Neoconidiobolus thromboides FSU 785]